MVYTKEEVIKASLEYFNGDTLATDVFVNKYALKKDDEYYELTPAAMWARMSDAFFRIENNYPNPVDYKEIFDAMLLKKLCPGGSILFGVGNPYVITSFANCFVLAGPEDNMSSIFNKARDMANISKRRGGVGIPLSTLRPDGAKVRNAAKTSSGAWSWGNFFSEAVRTVGQNSRRAALIETMDCSHPDIFKFIKMKQDLNQVTGANISVTISDAFIKAVKEDADWDLVFKGKVYETVKAKAIWKEIIQCATKTAEPGIIFWDTYCNNVPLHFYPDNQMVATNPCAELALSNDSSCRLLSINLKAFVKNPHTEDAEFDWDDYIRHIWLGVRLLDDVIDLELEALLGIIDSADTQDERVLFTRIREKCINDRRIGLGTFGLADALAAMRIRYDSNDALILIKNIYHTRLISAYEASIDLARERGAFPIYDSINETGNGMLRMKSPVLEQLPIEVHDDMERYGRRNGALLTDPPTGSISILFQTSSGIEPVFANTYTRRRKLSAEDTVIPDFVDEVGNKWQHYKVHHRNVQEYMEKNAIIDESELPEWFITANDINWEQRVKIQGAITRCSDGGVSSTLNLPKGTTPELVEKIYMTAWGEGCKGITVYVDGSRDGVLLRENPCNKSFIRPKELPCEIFHETVQHHGEHYPYVLIVGLREGEPFEVFGGEAQYSDLKKSHTKGMIIKHKDKSGSRYELVAEDGGVVWSLGESFNANVFEPTNRLISLSLRNGAGINFVVDQLNKCKTAELFAYAKVVSRVLKKFIKDGQMSDNHCPECKEKSLKYENGCVICISCGWSGCA